MAERLNREELVERIETAKKAIRFAGPIHRKDLQKHIYRMEKELRIYDYYHRANKS